MSTKKQTQDLSSLKTAITELEYGVAQVLFLNHNVRCTKIALTYGLRGECTAAEGLFRFKISEGSSTLNEA
jgi:hypothetical protein